MKLGVDSTRVVRPLFQAEDGGSIPTSTLQLVFRRIPWHVFLDLNRQWHSRLPECRDLPFLLCYGAEYDGLWYAVAGWSHPVSRLLPQLEWLELRRFSIAPDAPKNTASRMLGWMRREVSRSIPDVTRLISYQDLDSHSGCIYKAAGWKRADNYTIQARRRIGWGNRGVRRMDQSNAPKMRWELTVNANAALQPAPAQETER